MSNQNRKPRGVPSGGQFAAQTHAEADVTLTEPVDSAPAVDLPDPLPELKLSTTSRSVMHFLDNWRNEDQFDLNAPYQRESVWDEDRRRNLIRSLKMGLPVGAIVVAKLPTDREMHVRVVDGKQRIEAMRAFTHDEFAVPGHWFEDADLEDPTSRGRDVVYSDLSQRGRRDFENRQVGCIEFDSELVYLGRGDDGKAQWYQRTEDEMIVAEAELYSLVNFGGVDQTDEDRERAEQVAEDHRS